MDRFAESTGKQSTHARAVPEHGSRFFPSDTSSADVSSQDTPIILRRFAIHRPLSYSRYPRIDGDRHIIQIKRT